MLGELCVRSYKYIISNCHRNYENGNITFIIFRMVVSLSFLQLRKTHGEEIMPIVRWGPENHDKVYTTLKQCFKSLP